MKIILNDISKTYGKVKALADINMIFSPGIHGLLGPNGAGKTTLIRILATVLSSDFGSISCEDKMNQINLLEVKNMLGYLPQHFCMYKHLTVEEALCNVAVLKNIPKSRENEQIKLALERTNLADFIKKRVGQLSGGMIRRLGIAQAILGEPRLLILDEPSVGLDPSERINLRKLLRDYNDGNRIVIISSHIVNDVESLCDNVSIMNNGRVLISASIPEINALAAFSVIEEIVSENALRDLEKSNTIINFIPVASEYQVRYLSRTPKNESRVPPSLEDSYTYIIQRDL